MTVSTDDFVVRSILVSEEPAKDVYVCVHMCVTFLLVKWWWCRGSKTSYRNWQILPLLVVKQRGGLG